MSSNLSFNCALITGGGGGIGFALASYFLSHSKKVIIVGRTESKLAQAAKNLGKGVDYFVLDTGKTSEIPSFIEKVLKAHPEIDCVVNNAGVQAPLNVNDFDLAKADMEIDINIRGPMHLAIGFLPHLKTKEHGTIINVSSVLGFIPFSVINPVYNGTKAWVHFWSMNLRTQLKKEEGSKHVKVIEIVPPMVESDLHRDREDPDDNKKSKNETALTVDEFMDFVRKGMEDGKETISAGLGVDVVGKWYETFGEKYDQAASK